MKTSEDELKCVLAVEPTQSRTGRRWRMKNATRIYRREHAEIRHRKGERSRYDQRYNPETEAWCVVDGAHGHEMPDQRSAVLNPFDLRHVVGGAPVRATIARVMCACSANPVSAAISARLSTPPATRARARLARSSAR